MKEIRLCSIIMAGIFCFSLTYAQPKDVGTTVPNMFFSDINKNTFTLYEYLDKGYTVVIDISATWCGPCWNFHRTHTLQKLYEQYGPEGTIEQGKIIPIFIEGDPSTTLADLQGSGSNTQGNWVEGSDYHIVDAKSYSDYMPKFFKAGTTSVSFPTFFVICPDKKIGFTQVGAGSGATLNNFVSVYNNQCQASTGIINLIDGATFVVYPNPVSNVLNLSFTVTNNTPATITVTSIAGKVIHEESVKMFVGKQSKSIETSTWASGLYIVTLSTPDGNSVRGKIFKK